MILPFVDIPIAHFSVADIIALAGKVIQRIAKIITFYSEEGDLVNISVGRISAQRAAYLPYIKEN